MGRAIGSPSAAPCTSMKRSLCVHCHVEIDVGGVVLRVHQIEAGFSPHHSHAHRRDGRAERIRRDFVRKDQMVQRQRERDVAAGDGGGARAAIRLEDVAIHGDGALAEQIQIHRRAQAAPDHAPDLLGAPALDVPSRRARLGRAGQQGVFGSEPAAALLPARRAVGHADGAEDVGLAHLYNRRSFWIPDRRQLKAQ